MNDIKEYLKDLLVKKGINVDVSDGSPLGDLLIHPTVAMLTPTLEQIEYVWSVLGIDTPEIMSEEELDALCGNFLITRDPGAKATGAVELLYQTPQDLTIPEGTEFYTKDGYVFLTDRTYQVPKSSMTLRAYPYYSTGLIPIVAKVPGVEYNSAPLSVNGTNLTPAPVVVRNTSALEGGDVKETNSQLVSRLYASVRSRTLGSSKGIEAALKETFNTISEVTVKSTNDPEMLRDLVFESGLQNSYGYAYHKEDFYGKISGLTEYPHPQSSAYFTYFFDNPLTSGIQLELPMPEEFVMEVGTADYEGMYSLNDPMKASLSNKLLLETNFGSITTLGPEWLLSDVATIYNPEEVVPVSGKLRLGKRYSEEELLSSNVTVSAQMLVDILNFLYTIKTKGLPTTTQGADLK